MNGGHDSNVPLPVEPHSAKPESQSEYHDTGIAVQPPTWYSAAWDALGAVDSATSTSASNTSNFGVGMVFFLAREREREKERDRTRRCQQLMGLGVAVWLCVLVNHRPASQRSKVGGSVRFVHLLS